MRFIRELRSFRLGDVVYTHLQCTRSSGIAFCRLDDALDIGKQAENLRTEHFLNEGPQKQDSLGQLLRGPSSLVT
jgi:hypothetical protein